MFRQKFLTKDFTTKIIDKAAGKLPQDSLEEFLTLIENETNLHYFTKSSESNLLRIIQNQFDIAFFINECLKYPHQIEILISISNNSNYLTDILVRNPEYFHWIITPSILEQKADEKYFKSSLEKIISAFKSFDAKVNSVRNFKRKEILRIGLKDIYLKEELIKITQLLAELASSISAVLFDLCYNEILTKYSIEKTALRYVVVSIGKLGGGELNYSSDIDLIAFYDRNSFLNKKVFYNQILSETILLFNETASKKTGAGFLYRIDFRLRPDGRNAPLCGSFVDYLRYYESRGEDWERQMLIKANYLCGNKNLFKKFLTAVSRFIYPATFSISPIEQIKKLKSSIEQKNKSENNIKLVSGGIRDIEFSLQALQLLNGGKYIDIRTGNSLKAINQLLQKNILSNEEADNFISAYTLYRKAEHYLQLMNDQQTHTIPYEGELAEKLAHFLNFKDLKSFKDHLEYSKSKIQFIYNSIVGNDATTNIKNDFDKIFFADHKRARSNLEFLRSGKSLFDKKQFDNRTLNAFQKIETELFKYLYNSIDPDIVLENFARIIRSAQFPQIWYDEFTDSNFFNLFLSLCERSQKSIDLFAEDKLLRDNFLSRNSLIPIDKNSFANLTIKDFYFRTSIQLTAGIIDPNLFADLYTDFLNTKIISAAKNFVSDKDWKYNFFIAAMGSFGSRELSFASDVDLIFVASDIRYFPSIQKDFQFLLQNLKKDLPGIEIDCRLRPEGKSSQLVWDIEDYNKYFSYRARVWELQAFTKCRFILGNNNLFTDFINNYFNVIKEKDKELIKNEMIEMRKKLYPVSNSSFNLKKSSGGLVDTDFIVSFLFLTNPDLLLERLKFETSNYFNLFKKISGSTTNFNMIENNYFILKKLELLNQIISNTQLSKIPADVIKLNKLAKECGFTNSNLFIIKLNEIRELNKTFYQNIFN
jgi:[glutamine synthetase] adenylyltransferase / [glutamine synthetase]-adenylyl-L-tyrosine phosphorylase